MDSWAVAIEYRLAPPHLEMNTPAHPLPGKTTSRRRSLSRADTDVRDAIVYYRNDPRSNGEVVLIGGSAGGCHSLYLAATGTPGYDMPDLAVLLSGAASNLVDPNGWALDCVGGETCPHYAVANYLDIPDSAPNPPVGSDLALAQEASSTHWMHVGMCPFGPCVQAKIPWEFQRQLGSTFTRTCQITRRAWVLENGGKRHCANSPGNRIN